jgi:hypothetical protein
MKEHQTGTWAGHAGRVPEVSSGCKQCIIVVVCVNRCVNLYLSKGIPKRFKVADTRGSTATGALFKKNQKRTMYVSVCALTQDKPETREEQSKNGDGDS